VKQTKTKTEEKLPRSRDSVNEKVMYWSDLTAVKDKAYCMCGVD
jgi:hypothetical protein